jgi:ThiS family.
VSDFRVTVRLPESLRSRGAEIVVIDLPVANLSELSTQLRNRVPRFATADRSMYNFAVNGELVVHGENATPIRNGDAVEIVVVFAGG